MVTSLEEANLREPLCLGGVQLKWFLFVAVPVGWLVNMDPQKGYIIIIPLKLGSIIILY